MPLSIKNKEVERLVAEVAALTGESKTEAVRQAREQLVPSRHEARIWNGREDWANAAWAYGVLAELEPERADFTERAERARRHCD